MGTNKIKQHTKFLKEQVFFINTKWPHFDLLFKDIERLSKDKKIKNVVSLERGSLYGDISLFAPYFNNKNQLIVVPKKFFQEVRIIKNMLKVIKL